MWDHVNRFPSLLLSISFFLTGLDPNMWCGKALLCLYVVGQLRSTHEPLLFRFLNHIYRGSILVLDITSLRGFDNLLNSFLNPLLAVLVRCANRRRYLALENFSILILLGKEQLARRCRNRSVFRSYRNSFLRLVIRVTIRKLGMPKVGLVTIRGRLSVGTHHRIQLPAFLLELSMLQRWHYNSRITHCLRVSSGARSGLGSQTAEAMLLKPFTPSHLLASRPSRLRGKLTCRSRTALRGWLTHTVGNNHANHVALLPNVLVLSLWLGGLYLKLLLW